MNKTFLRMSFSMLLVIVAVNSIAVAQTPHIASLSLVSAQQFQTITINGAGFGTLAPYTGDSNYISFGDSTHAWEAGYAPDGNTQGLIVNSWTDSQIVLGGFSTAQQQYLPRLGDKVRVCVSNAQTGGAFACKGGRVKAIPTSTTLTSSPNPSTSGEVVTFTAVVESSGGTPPDGEMISFMAGTTVLGTGTLSGGTATFTTSTLSVGTTVVKAVYSGDSQFKGSKSKLVKQVVN